MPEQSLRTAAFDTPAGEPRRRLGFGLRLLLFMLRGIAIGTLEVELPDGSRRQFRGPREGPRATLALRNGGVVRRVLINGEVGFGEAYVDGCWDSPDLVSLLCLMDLNEPYYRGPYEKNWLARVYGRWQHRHLRRNSKRRARRNIEAHYDLGNDFYRLWLDETMTYSSALFAEVDEPLEQAQRRKFDALIARLGLRPEHHLLEIGCGWGGFAIHAARTTGCRVTGITLSPAQLAWARRAAHTAGLGDRVAFELRDYRDVEGCFDRVASIEMYEAVGERYWPAYFAAIRRLLVPGGVAAIQGITISETIWESYRYKQDFIQKHIFPGGMLATVRRFHEEAEHAGLGFERPSFHGADYARTLARWHQRVLNCRETIARSFDERFLRLWRYYLAYCEAGFSMGKIDLMQVSLRKPA